MNQDWKVEAPTWIAALERALKDRHTDDLLIPYAQVALAFPSSDPHPYTFEYPRIDDHAIRAWAEDNGWKIAFAAEKGAKGQEHSFPIRLTKKESK